MCQYPGATEHVAVADRRKTNRANAMKELLAHRQHIDVRGRRSSSLGAYVANIVHVAAKAGMRFQPPSVGQVDHPRANIIDRRMGVRIGWGTRLVRRLQGGKPLFGGCCALW